MVTIRAKIRWFLAGIFVLVLVPIAVSVVGEFFIEWAKEQGYYNNPSRRLSAIVTALTWFANQPWFLYPATALGGLTIGVWLDFLLRKKEPQTFRAQITAEGLAEARELMRNVAEYKSESARRELMLALSDLYDEGVTHRNRVQFETRNFDLNGEQSKLYDWDRRTLAKLRNELLDPKYYTNFRTLNQFRSKYEEGYGKTPQQAHLESIWNEKLKRLNSAMYEGLNKQPSS
jgi:hypothetical protein